MKATVAQSVRTGGADPKRIYVDRGYRGHDYDGKARVIVAGQKCGPTPTMRREQKRRNGPVAVIGDAINADLGPLEWTPVIGFLTCKGVSDGEEETPAFSR
ncbi:MAG: hypothetical protein R3F54_23700 [Alphaproteobacteria bacterium]